MGPLHRLTKSRSVNGGRFGWAYRPEVLADISLDIKQVT